jgi:HlyD family secretion protein
MRQLLAEGVISQSEFDKADGRARAAEAEFVAARQHALVARAEPLTEDRALADALIASAKGDRQAADARLQKCTIRSPLDGVVLRRHLEPGERVSAAANTPIVTIADLSELRVRAEVDERDVAAVERGQVVKLTADALAGERVAGVVLRISSSMGRKRVRSGDPAEKADRDVLEVVVRVLENDPRLVVGLRVTAIFSSNSRPAPISRTE